MSAWLLPDHIADVLPSEARHIEELRRGLLDTARSYGYELIMPPMLEYLDSLLTGAGEALNLQTGRSAFGPHPGAAGRYDPASRPH